MKGGLDHHAMSRRTARKPRGVRYAAIVFLVGALAVAATAAPSGLRLSQPVLRVGTSGPLVADWQRVVNEWLVEPSSSSRADLRLRHRIGSHLSIDGVFGPLTEAATRQWQRDYHVRPTGSVTIRDWVAWIGANNTCCGAGYPNFTGKFERRPDPTVAWWQLAVARWLPSVGLSPS